MTLTSRLVSVTSHAIVLVLFGILNLLIHTQVLQNVLFHKMRSSRLYPSVSRQKLKDLDGVFCGLGVGTNEALNNHFERVVHLSLHKGVNLILAQKV